MASSCVMWAPRASPFSPYRMNVSRDYGVELNYELGLRAKVLALREIYGKEESSYMELLWYTDALRRTNPGSHIVLESIQQQRLLETCAYATTEKKFEDAYACFRSKGGEKVRKFLDAIPLECWANLCFKGQRYGEMTLALAESFNGWIKFERTPPVTPRVDTIRIKMMKMMSECREKCRSWKGLLCPKIEKLIATNFEVGRTWDLAKSSDFVYEVHSDPSHRVDLMNWFCRCTEWQLRGIPCVHVVCAIQRSGTPIFQFVNSYYSAVNYLNAYLHPIKPIPNYDKPNIDPKALTVLPPIVKLGPRRPRKKRIESARNNDKKAKKRIEVGGINDKKAKKRVEVTEIIDKKARRCGRCKQLCLHTSRTFTTVLD
ncbi:zinc finger protein [Macleaya cordata]|uniref:Zinc finger protein n=1 Tax=Macleaya cordata TaxID=56857 RepID=A0A200QCR4_MACCD|nr:zinc finger protein [Macleaya cordata]